MESDQVTSLASRVPPWRLGYHNRLPLVTTLGDTSRRVEAAMALQTLSLPGKDEAPL